MRITVSAEILKVLAYRYLLDQKGIKVSLTSATWDKHIEGQYDESVEVVDGISFELEDTPK